MSLWCTCPKGPRRPAGELGIFAVGDTAPRTRAGGDGRRESFTLFLGGTTMLFQKKLTRLGAFAASGLMAAAAMTVSVLPLSGTEGTDGVGTDVDAVPEGLGRWFSVHGLLALPASPEGPEARPGCVLDGSVTVGAGGAGGTGCPEWVRLDFFRDVDYGDGGIGVTMCRLTTDNPPGTNVGATIGVDLKVFKFGITIDADRGDMCGYQGCGLVISESLANYAARN